MAEDEEDDLAGLCAAVGRIYPIEEAVFHVGGRPWTLWGVQDLDTLLRIAGPGSEEFPHGVRLWVGAVGLAERLLAEPGLVANHSVLELGSGVGLPGIVAQSLEARVTQTDYQPAALSLSRINALQNGIDGIRSLLADWRGFPDVGHHDVVMGADVLYSRALRPSLANIVSHIVRPGRVIFADRIPAQIDYFAGYLKPDGWEIATERRVVAWEGAEWEVGLLIGRR